MTSAHAHHHAPAPPSGHASAHAAAHVHPPTDATAAADLAAMLDLDAVVLRDTWDAVFALVTAAAPAPARVVDLGAGTGAGTTGLLDRYPAAEVVAVDVDPALPAHLAAALAARPAGDAERVRTVVADLDDVASLAGLGPVDLAWASMSLHHLADPGALLGAVHAALRPGGVVAVVEFDEPLQHLAGGPGEVEERLRAPLRAAQTAAVPHLAPSWTDRFDAAGFVDVAETVFDVDLRAPRSPAALDYTRRWLARMAHGFADSLPPADRAALLALTEPGALRSTDLHLRGRRTLTLGRRPA